MNKYNKKRKRLQQKQKNMKKLWQQYWSLTKILMN